MTELEILQSLCEACRRLHDRNLLAAGDGNLSARLPDGRIAMTPAGVAKAWITPGDFAFLAPDGTILQGQPSSERLMHLAIYAACPEAMVVVHAHPPTAVAWTLARPDLQAMPAESLPEVILSAGAIPIVPYARPGTAALGEALKPFLPAHRLLVLARHGAVCWGEDLAEAAGGIERLEHVAQILKAAVELGGLSPLSGEELAALRRLRAELGPRIR
jgi:L-fuculose-phosphate aldolase